MKSSFSKLPFVLVTALALALGWAFLQAGKTFAQKATIFSEDSVLVLRNGPRPNRTADSLSQLKPFSIPGEDLMFSVFVPSSGPSNIDFRAYFSEVVFTNGAPMISMPSSVVSADYFVTNSTHSYTGTNTISVTPGGWTEVPFRLKESKFRNEGKGDVLLTIIPFVTGGTNQPYQGAVTYPIDSAEDGLQE